VRSSLASIAFAFAATFAASTPALAQNTMAQRVSRAPDGVVHVQFAARPATCGDGKDLIGFRKALFAESFQSIGDWNAPNCRPGPVRVAISVTNGRVTRVKTYVGGSWARTSERVTDLGAVPSSEAAAYFFALVPQIEGGSRGDKSRILLPAVLADDPGAVQRLISIARDDARLEKRAARRSNGSDCSAMRVSSPCSSLLPAEVVRRRRVKTSTTTRVAPARKAWRRRQWRRSARSRTGQEFRR
jgi:hypothetical protein